MCANTSKSALDKLLKLKLLRILLNKRLSTPFHDLYAALNIWPVSKLHEIQLLLFMHKCFYHKHLLPVIFHNYFSVNSSVHQHFTRHNFDLHISTVNSNFGQRSTGYRASSLWNKLPTDLKSITSVTRFKKAIMLHLRSKFV